MCIALNYHFGWRWLAALCVLLVYVPFFYEEIYGQAYTFSPGIIFAINGQAFKIKH
jgi:hypothetical protein